MRDFGLPDFFSNDVRLDERRTGGLRANETFAIDARYSAKRASEGPKPAELRAYDHSEQVGWGA